MLSMTFTDANVTDSVYQKCTFPAEALGIAIPRFAVEDYLVKILYTNHWSLPGAG